MTATTDTSYAAHRGYVLAVLGRRCGWLDESDREAMLHDAYAVLLEKQRDGLLDRDAMHPSQVRAYLTQTALNKALDEGKRVGRKRSVALDDGGLEVAGTEPDAETLLNDSFDGARLREIVAELPERQQAIIKLRFFFDRAPEEVQSYLGVTERVYRRELERAMRALATRFELVRDGTFCDSRRSLILAFVAGIAGPNRVQDARRHLASCPGCAHWAVELQETARRAGAVAPVPVVAADGDRLGQFGRALDAVRERLGEMLGGARDHATGVALRTDPASGSMLAGARPGAVAAVVAGCLTIGSTATYCALDGVPQPLRALVGAPAAKEHEAAAKTKPRPPPAATRPASAAVAPASVTRGASSRAASSPTSRSGATKTTTKTTKPTRRQATKPAQTPGQRRRASIARRQRSTAPEFGVEGGTSSSASGGGTSAAPASGGGTTAGAASTGSAGAASGGTSGGTSPGGGGTSSGKPSGSGGDWGSEFGP